MPGSFQGSFKKVKASCEQSGSSNIEKTFRSPRTLSPLSPNWQYWYSRNSKERETELPRSLAGLELPWVKGLKCVWEGFF